MGASRGADPGGGNGQSSRPSAGRMTACFARKLGRLTDRRHELASAVRPSNFIRNGNKAVAAVAYRNQRVTMRLRASTVPFMIAVAVASSTAANANPRLERTDTAVSVALAEPIELCKDGGGAGGGGSGGGGAGAAAPEAVLAVVVPEAVALAAEAPEAAVLEAVAPAGGGAGGSTLRRRQFWSAVAAAAEVAAAWCWRCWRRRDGCGCDTRRWQFGWCVWRRHRDGLGSGQCWSSQRVRIQRGLQWRRRRLGHRQLLWEGNSGGKSSRLFPARDLLQPRSLQDRGRLLDGRLHSAIAAGTLSLTRAEGEQSPTGDGRARPLAR